MEKNSWKELLEQIDTFNQSLKDHYDPLVSSEELSNMTLKDYNALLLFSKQALSKMTAFIQNELYHIIGMGDLTHKQTIELCNRVKIMTSYRTKVHYFTSNRANITYNNWPPVSSYEIDTFIKLKLEGENQ